MLNKIVDFSEAKLKLLIQNTSEHISNYKPIGTKKLEELENCDKYNLRDIFKYVDSVDNIKQYEEIETYNYLFKNYRDRFENDSENKYLLLKEATNEGKIVAQEALDILNSKLKKYNEAALNRIKKLSDDLNIIVIINDFLYQDNSYNTPYEDICQIIYTQNFSEDVIIKLTEKIANKYIEMQQNTIDNEVEEFEESLFAITESNNLITENYHYIMSLIEENVINVENDDISIYSDLYLSEEEFKEYINNSYIDVCDFSMVLSNILYYMDNTEDIEKKEEYKKLAKKYVMKYKNIEKIDIEIEDLSDKIMFYFNQNMLNNDYTNLTELSVKLEETKIKFKNGVNVEEDIEMLKCALSSIIDEQNDIIDMEQANVKIKSLVLFDTYVNENNEVVPYVLSDLDKNNPVNMIDPSIEKEKIGNCYQDLNDLIEDLTIFDAPKVTIGNSDKLNKIVTSVFKKNRRGEVIRTLKNDTGMKRIRPTTSSNVRFIDEKFIFKPGTETYSELVRIVKETFPSVEIDESENFSLYINYMNGFKRKEEDGYSKAILRQKASCQRDFLERILNKNTLTDSEKEYLTEMLQITKQTYSNLTELDSNLKFNCMKKMMGGYDNQWS